MGSYMRRLISTILLLPFTLTGCLLNNTYHKPEVEVANQWTVGDRNIISKNEQNTPYLAWCTLLNIKL